MFKIILKLRWKNGFAIQLQALQLQRIHEKKNEPINENEENVPPTFAWGKNESIEIILFYSFFLFFFLSRIHTLLSFWMQANASKIQARFMELRSAEMYKIISSKMYSEDIADCFE